HRGGTKKHPRDHEGYHPCHKPGRDFGRFYSFKRTRYAGGNLTLFGRHDAPVPVTRNPTRSNLPNRPDKAVALPRHRLYVNRLVRLISKRQPQLIPGCIHVCVIVDVRAFRPQLRPQIFTAHHFSSALEQSYKCLIDLPWKLDARTILKELLA